MGDENKGIGKEYKPEEFSQPEKEVGSESKKHLWVGAVVLIVALAAGGLFMFGPWGSSSGETSGITGATIVAYCADSDGGYNRYTKGVTAGTYSLDYSEGEYVDKCAGDENKLTEYYCKNDLVVFTTEPCPEGMVCADGVCMTA